MRVVGASDGERLLGRPKGFNRDGRLDGAVEALAMPVDRRALLRVEIGNLDAQAAGSCLAGKSTSKGRFSDPALLTDEGHHRWHSCTILPLSNQCLAYSCYLAAS